MINLQEDKVVTTYVVGVHNAYYVDEDGYMYSGHGETEEIAKKDLIDSMERIKNAEYI